MKYIYLFRKHSFKKRNVLYRATDETAEMFSSRGIWFKSIYKNIYDFGLKYNVLSEEEAKNKFPKAFVLIS